MQNIFKGLNIMVCGEAGLDRYVSGISIRVSPEANVPVITDATIDNKAGLAANVVNNLRALGADAALFTMLGDDEAGHQIYSLGKVDCVTDPSRATITKNRILSNNKQVARLDVESCDPVSRDIGTKYLDMLKHNLPNYDAVILQDYGKGLWTKQTLSFIKYAQENGKKVFVDPYRGRLAKDYEGAYLIKPNLDEAREMSMYRHPDYCAMYIKRKSKAACVVITAGADGMYAIDRGKHIHVPTKPANPVDITGAGDTALAVLTCMLMTGHTLTNSMKIANKAARKVIMRLGVSTVGVKDL